MQNLNLSTLGSFYVSNSDTTSTEASEYCFFLFSSFSGVNRIMNSLQTSWHDIVNQWSNKKLLHLNVTALYGIASLDYELIRSSSFRKDAYFRMPIQLCFVRNS